jgi:hypothetical protein
MYVPLRLLAEDAEDGLFEEPPPQETQIRTNENTRGSVACLMSFFTVAS